MEQQEARTEHAATIDLTADDDVPVAPPAARDERRAGGGGPAPPAGMPPMPPLRRSENSKSDSSLPDFAAASPSESESEGEAAAASLEAALRRLTPRMPPLRRSASSASDSSLPVAIRCIRSGRVDGVSRHSFRFHTGPRLRVVFRIGSGVGGLLRSRGFCPQPGRLCRVLGGRRQLAPRERHHGAAVAGGGAAAASRALQLVAMASTPCQRPDARNSKLGESYHMPERGGVRNRRRAKSCTP